LPLSPVHGSNTPALVATTSTTTEQGRLCYTKPSSLPLSPVHGSNTPALVPTTLPTTEQGRLCHARRGSLPRRTKTATDLFAERYDEPFLSS
jgi:hypothetical protein